MIDYCCDSLDILRNRSALKEYTIRHIFFESGYKMGISAYLFIPKPVGVHPAVVYLNFEYKDGQSFIEEVESLVMEGFITLIIDSPFLTDSHSQKPLDKTIFRETIENLVEIETNSHSVLTLRAAVDFLSAMPSVDKERIGYIGYGLGAAWGGVLAGIEDRIRTYILVAGSPKASDWYLKSRHCMAEFLRFLISPERYEYFISNVEKLNALQYIKNAAPASIFFQFAQHDDFVTKEQSASYFSAASFPKNISWYNTDHFFTNCPEAAQDRLDWLNSMFQKRNGKPHNPAGKEESLPF